MTDNETEKENLLNQFQQFLDHQHLDEFDLEKQPDLNHLLSEMAALKTEVKTESRQYKATLDSLSAALETVTSDNQALTTELALHEQLLAKQKNEMLKTMLTEMVDLYDKFQTGLEMVKSYQPQRGLFKRSRKKDVRYIQSIQDGQQISLKRFEQLLQRHQVEIIECQGEPFNPQTMAAIETGFNLEQENGVVLEELRKGFLHQGRVLRPAEVKVNKIK